jgi:hypothetical protein
MNATRWLEGCAVLVGLALLNACAGEPPPGTTTNTPGLEGAALQRAAVAIWREDAPAIRPKGSCAACHGADFFDLARIGTPDATTVRRAVIDGATPAEAETLARAITALRQTAKLEPADHLEFRPFQPGGAVLPGADNRARDIAFGKQLETLTPTLMGARIDSLEAAKKARDELLALPIRDLKVGFDFPRWSADNFNVAAHGTDHGTLNDWVSDLAVLPKPDKKTEWYALQDAYLQNPTTENFWRYYGAIPSHTQVFGATDPRATRLARLKFESALIGQQMMRVQASGDQSFLRGPIAFSYLDNAPYRSALFTTQDFQYDGILPAAAPWDIGDQIGRSTLQSALTAKWDGPVTDALKELGFPQFVQDSVSAKRNRWQEGDDLRLDWFWIGFMLDPSFNRLGKSGSTKGGEYINQTLNSRQLYIHDLFTIAARNVFRTLPDAQTEYDFAGKKRVTPLFSMQYYFFQYHSPKDTDLLPEQRALWGHLGANFSRMAVYLYLESLVQGAAKFHDAKGATDTFDRMRRYFSTQPQHALADAALLGQLEALKPWDNP